MSSGGERWNYNILTASKNSLTTSNNVEALLVHENAWFSNFAADKNVRTPLHLAWLSNISDDRMLVALAIFQRWTVWHNERPEWANGSWDGRVASNF